MRRILYTTASLAALALSTTTARAAAVQADMSFAGAFPVGVYETGDRAEDVFDAGVGVLGDVLWGINDNLMVGAGVGVYRNGGGYFDYGFGTGGEHIVYHLTSVPVHGLVLWREGQPEGFGYYAEGGLGFTHHSFSVEHFDELDGSQTSFSYLLGAGVSFPLNRRWDLTGGLAFNQAITTSDSDVWYEGDNPKSLLLTIGFRWHQE